MNERKYIVEMDGHVVARGMDIYTAAILCKALADEYYIQMEAGGTITMKMEEVCKND